MTAIEDFLADTGPSPAEARDTPDTIEAVSDRYGRHVYTDDLPACPLAPSGKTVQVLGVTSQIKPIKNSFEDHAAKTVAAWAVDNHAIWKDLDREAAVTLVAGERKRALDKAAGRGLSIHKIIDAAREGQDQLVVTNPDAAPYLAAVKAFLRDARPEFVLGEVAVFNRTYDYGGKFDVAMRLGAYPELGLVIGDWKTRAKHAAYQDNAAQLGGYARAEYYIQDGRRHPMPDFDGAVVVTFAPDGTWAIHPIDLKQAWELCQAAIGCYQVDKAVKPIGKKIIAATPRAPGADDLEQLLGASVEKVEQAKLDELEAMLDAPSAQPKDELEALLDHAKAGPTEISLTLEERIAAANAGLRVRLGEAVQAGAPAGEIRWPAGVPTFKQGGPATWEQVLQVEACVLGAEKAIGAPFQTPLPADPTVVDETAAVDSQRHVVTEAPPVTLKADPEQVGRLHALYDTLPVDLQREADELCTNHDVPTNRTRWTTDHLPIVTAAIEAKVAEGVARVEQIEQALAGYDNPTRNAVMACATGEEQPPIVTIDRQATARICVLSAGIDQGHLHAGPAGVTVAWELEPLVKLFESKTRLVDAGKTAAVLYGRPKPRSAADVALDPVLVAGAVKALDDGENTPTTNEGTEGAQS